MSVVFYNWLFTLHGYCLMTTTGRSVYNSLGVDRFFFKNFIEVFLHLLVCELFALSSVRLPARTPAHGNKISISQMNCLIAFHITLCINHADLVAFPL